MPELLTPQQLDAAEAAFRRGWRDGDEIQMPPALVQRAALLDGVEATVYALTEQQLIQLLAAARRRRLLAESEYGGIETQCPLRHERWAEDTDDAIGAFIELVLGDVHHEVTLPDAVDWYGEEAEIRSDRIVDRVRQYTQAREEGI